jgi:hypothetical protein
MERNYYSISKWDVSVIKVDHGIAYYIIRPSVYCYIMTYHDDIGMDTDYTACHERYSYLMKFQRIKLEYHSKKLMYLMLTGLFT